MEDFSNLIWGLPPKNFVDEDYQLFLKHRQVIFSYIRLVGLKSFQNAKEEGLLPPKVEEALSFERGFLDGNSIIDINDSICENPDKLIIAVPDGILKPEEYEKGFKSGRKSILKTLSDDLK